MKISRLTAAMFLVGAAGGFLYACSAPQPLPECAVTSGNVLFNTPNHWATFKLKSGTGPCSQLRGDQVGLQHYRAPNSKEGTLAIRTHRLGNLYRTRPAAGRDPNDPDGKKINAIGKYPYLPDGDGICTATDFQPAEQNFAAATLADGGTLPARSIRYRWSNVRVINTANVPGTVWTAELEYTEDVDGPGPQPECTATYDVTGVWPMVQCHQDEDENGNPIPGSENAYCDPNPDIDAGRAFGSGINPDFKPKCDLELGVCLPSVPLDQLR